MSQILPAFHFWRPATWLYVAGPDAFTFLQGQFSNDLRALEKAESVYGLWLNQKGRVLADSFVVKAEGPGAFWVGSYFSPLASVRERLESHLIADEVQIEDQTGRWHGLTIFGSAEPADAGASGRGWLSFPGRRGGDSTREWLMPRELDQPPGQGISAAGMEERRLLAGIPAVPADLGPGDLPQEGGLEVGALSFNKGCYLGQEVMARLQSMGTPRRRLFRVAGTGTKPPAGTPLQQEGKAIGEMRSATMTAHGCIGLAMLQLTHLRSEQPLTVAASGETLRVVAPV